MLHPKTVISSCLTVLLAAGFSYATIELRPVAAFTVPNLAEPIEQVRLADIDGDGGPEVLACDGESLVLYSATLDSTLFQTRLDSTFLDPGSLELWPRNHRIEFGDVNRDSAADIIAGYYFSADGLNSDVCYLVFYDGASGYTDVDTVNLDTGDGHVTNWASYGLTALQAVDFEGDGYQELLVAWERNFLAYGSGDLEFTNGSTRLYHSFPDSVAWTRDKLLSLCSDVIHERDSAYIVASRRKYFLSGMTTDVSTYRTEAAILYPDGDIWVAVAAEQPSGCEGNYAYGSYAASTKPLCWGDMDTVSTELEMLVAFSWSRDCAYPDYSHVTGSGASLEMHVLSVHQPDAPLWVAGGTAAGVYVFIPEYPATYFRATSNGLFQHNASDGALLDEADDVPPGWKFWDDPYDDGVTMLVAVNDREVSLFSLDVRTAVDDPAEAPNVPTTFTLGQPYPNPFNAVLSVPVTVRRSGPARVEVFDLLGRRVDILFDGVLRVGMHILRWPADDMASGVYLIRAVTADESASVKVTLLK